MHRSSKRNATGKKMVLRKVGLPHILGAICVGRSLESLLQLICLFVLVSRVLH